MMARMNNATNTIIDDPRSEGNVARRHALGIAERTLKAGFIQAVGSLALAEGPMPPIFKLLREFTLNAQSRFYATSPPVYIARPSVRNERFSSRSN